MNDTNSLISVIVPIYNVEQYLSRCIESIISQTYSNLEIILVNDGSTDESGKIAERFAEKDNRIIVLNQENGGLSAARNTGLRKAKGSYIGFVDSDDYIDPDFYKELLSLIKSNDEVDISSGIDVGVYDGGLIVEDKSINDQIIISREQLIHFFLFRNGGPSSGVCNKLFKRKVIQDLFFPKGFINEDSVWLASVYKRSCSLGWTSKSKYYYCHREGSITRSSFKNHINDYIVMNSFLKEEMKELDYDFIDDGCRMNLLYAYRETILNLLRYRGDVVTYRELRKKYRQTIRTIHITKYFRFSRVIKLVLFYISPKTFSILKGLTGV